VSKLKKTILSAIVAVAALTLAGTLAYIVGDLTFGILIGAMLGWPAGQVVAAIWLWS
jgi:hypothetical protein